MTLAPTSLQMLPVGAGYHEKSGQANLKITKGEGDTLYIEASCDSLQRIVIAYQKEITTLRSQIEEIKTEPPNNKPTVLQWFWIRLGQLATIILIGWLVIRKLKKHVNFNT